jgi:hypothetical protein
VKLLGLAVFLYAPDAHAWGLQTHLFFAQYVLAAAPLADPEFRAAAARLPRLVLAGACLPDLAIVGRFFLHTAAFRRSHLWATLRRIAASPRTEHERALALGYATHLISDVVAHNEFVPEHEARIGNTAMIAHLVSEWAMDAHVRQELAPSQVLEEAGWHAVEFVARGFRCGEILAHRALQMLIKGDRFLRASPIPSLCRTAVRRKDRHSQKRVSLYLSKTMQGLADVEAALAGGFEDWSGLDPEGSECDGGADRRAREHVARIVQAEYDTGSRREHGEGNEQRGKLRIVGTGHERERHRVKRVA